MLYFALAFGCIHYGIAIGRWILRGEVDYLTELRAAATVALMLALFLSSVALCGAGVGVLIPGMDGRGAIAALLALIAGGILFLAFAY